MWPGITHTQQQTIDYKKIVCGRYKVFCLFICLFIVFFFIIIVILFFRVEKITKEHNYFARRTKRENIEERKILRKLELKFCFDLIFVCFWLKLHILKKKNIHFLFCFLNIYYNIDIFCCKLFMALLSKKKNTRWWLSQSIMSIFLSGIVFCSWHTKADLDSSNCSFSLSLTISHCAFLWH